MPAKKIIGQDNQNHGKIKISRIALEETCDHKFVGGLLLWTENTPSGAFVFAE